MVSRRLFLQSSAAVAASCAASGIISARAGNAIGVTDTEIRIGQTMPYSGPASAWGAVGRAELAYIKMINDRGGVRGRKITLLSLDDGFNPSKTVEMTRALVENENVAFIWGSLGLGALAVRDYLNRLKVPQAFILTALEQINDPQHYPWTIGFLPTLYREGFVQASYILTHKPDAKIAFLHPNNADGIDCVKGFTAGLGDRAERMIIKDLSYELSDATVFDQMVQFQASGADTFYNVGYPKFAAQAIRKASDLNWKPLHILSYISSSIHAVLEPAGFENAIGIVCGQFWKDPTDPSRADDPYTKDYLAWLQKYVVGGKPDDIFLSAGYNFSQPLIYLLEQCGDDLSRENIMLQAASFHKVSFPWLLPGLTISTSPTDYQPINDFRETRFNGRTWDLLDD